MKGNLGQVKARVLNRARTFLHSVREAQTNLRATAGHSKMLADAHARILLLEEDSRRLRAFLEPYPGWSAVMCYYSEAPGSGLCVAKDVRDGKWQVWSGTGKKLGNPGDTPQEAIRNYYAMHRVRGSETTG